MVGKLFERITSYKDSLIERIMTAHDGIVQLRLRQTKALKLRILLIWKHSGARSFLVEKGQDFIHWYASFNLLNSASHGTARILRRAGFHPTAEKVDCSMQEENGINRHVLFRYLMKELFLYFFIAFLFFFMVFFVNQILLLAESVLKQRVPLASVFRLISYSLPMVIAQSAPFATLVGFLMCLGRLATENEVLIFRASGQGYRIILIPVLILGLLISIASFFVNDYLLPVGTLKFNRLKKEIIVSNPAVELESNSIKRTNDKTLVIGQVSKQNVSDLLFFDTDSDGKQRIIIADKSTVQKSTGDGVLMTIDMATPTVITLDSAKKKSYEYVHADEMSLNIFESTFFDTKSNIRPSEMTSYDLSQKIKAMEKLENIKPKELNRYKLEYNKKFSVPFGSIFFAILALPLALLFGKHNGQTIGLIIGLFISVAYWAMMIIGQIFGSRSGLSGFWTMWLPNILIGSSGILFYIKLVRK